eukprot:11539964-Karenia_brevis.AAC.1
MASEYNRVMGDVEALGQMCRLGTLLAEANTGGNSNCRANSAPPATNGAQGTEADVLSARVAKLESVLNNGANDA